LWLQPINQKEFEMTILRTNLAKGAVIAFAAAGALLASTASAATYTVCNQWNECWQVHEHLSTYPADVHVVWHDDAWRMQHEHDAQMKWLNNPSDDHGWYDKDGAWHAFGDSPPPR
jgi:hypothetical protein